MTDPLTRRTFPGTAGAAAAESTAGLEVDSEPKIVDTLLEQVAGRPRVDRRPPADAYVQAVLDSAPLAFWRMDEIDGWTAEDASSGRPFPGRTDEHRPGQRRPAEPRRRSSPEVQ